MFYPGQVLAGRVVFVSASRHLKPGMGFGGLGVVGGLGIFHCICDRISSSSLAVDANEASNTLMWLFHRFNSSCCCTGGGREKPCWLIISTSAWKFSLRKNEHLPRFLPLSSPANSPNAETCEDWLRNRATPLVLLMEEFANRSRNLNAAGWTWLFALYPCLELGWW